MGGFPERCVAMGDTDCILHRRCDHHMAQTERLRLFLAVAVNRKCGCGEIHCTDCGWFHEGWYGLECTCSCHEDITDGGTFVESTLHGE